MSHPHPALTPDSLACLGGGHGLYQTLLAARQLEPDRISAIVTVADDGGSSGRIRRELGHIPPGDLRMALAALSHGDSDGQMWAQTLQHRFGGTGALAGHAVGNLLIAGLTDVLGSQQAALDEVARLTRSAGRVLPMVNRPLDIEADVAGLDRSDPRILLPVRGQVAVATTPGQVRRVRLSPENPAANPAAVEAIEQADMITIGPGSWFSSVIPHLLVDGLVDAAARSDGVTVIILNLTAEPGETQGFTAERHIHVLQQHCRALRADAVLIDSHALMAPSQRDHLQRAAAVIGARAVFADVRKDAAPDVHDPGKLALALQEIYREC